MRRRAEHPLRALRALRGRDERGDERERGSVAMYVVLFTPAVFLLAGLLVDGGLAIHARQRAADMAEQAARAGANEIDTDALRATGRPAIDPGRARAAACDLLGFYGAQVAASRCDADDQEVEVTVQIKVEPQLLGIVPGLGTFTMTSTASARPVTGNGPQ
ncbi:MULTISPECIES: TadE/TadG family type IV pilus assembly protein [Thermomonosporaceae]|uniref:TadE/TadG family type IV pilus assembly protein n=1 Tax=Thermomonosporaceae TaxID=2012 RepID=UPI00255A83BF|nr:MULTISPECIES: pilus assembly protein TadG-related protein [Thermomonosporaceae]MDL4776115.1 pilus assembly protein TadG-related protein [Actinomadura xylanilytica]